MSFPIAPTVGDLHSTPSGQCYQFSVDGGWRLHREPFPVAPFVNYLYAQAPFAGALLLAPAGAILGIDGAVLYPAGFIVDLFTPSITLDDPLGMIAGSTVVLPSDGLWQIDINIYSSPIISNGASSIQTVLNGVTPLAADNHARFDPIDVAALGSSVLREFSQGDVLDFRFADDQVGTQPLIVGWSISLFRHG